MQRVEMEGLDDSSPRSLFPRRMWQNSPRLESGGLSKRSCIPGTSWSTWPLTITLGLWCRNPGSVTSLALLDAPPHDSADVERILRLGVADTEGDPQVKTAIPFKSGDRVRVKEGYFQNFEGDVDVVDEANGRVTVMINIFGRSTPVELEHWQIEKV